MNTLKKVLKRERHRTYVLLSTYAARRYVLKCQLTAEKQLKKELHRVSWSSNHATIMIHVYQLYGLQLHVLSGRISLDYEFVENLKTVEEINPSCTFHDPKTMLLLWYMIIKYMDCSYTCYQANIFSFWDATIRYAYHV